MHVQKLLDTATIITHVTEPNRFKATPDFNTTMVTDQPIHEQNQFDRAHLLGVTSFFCEGLATGSSRMAAWAFL